MRIVCSALLFASNAVATLDVSDAAWLEWRQLNNREYASQAEQSLRRSAWEAYSRQIAEKNVRNPLATFVVDGSADFTEAEHHALLSWNVPNTTGSIARSTRHVSHLELEVSAIDWRDTLVTNVKNQGSCGTCWSFAMIGMMEAAWAKAGNGLISLSNQKVIDCACGSQVYGMPVGSDCSGGVPSEQNYPYEARCEASGACHDAPVAATIDSVQCLPNCGTDEAQCQSEEPDLLQWLQNGPVGISIAADFGGYSSGILTDCGDRSMNHAVLLVGYGEENGVKYWLLKNSWGQSWGENGFWRMQYGVNCLGLRNGGPCQAQASSAPSPSPSPSPTPGACAFIGEYKDFVGSDVRAATYSGSTDEEKDASCCSQCDAEPECEFWVRATDVNGCWLKRNFGSFQASGARRGNFKTPPPSPSPSPTPVGYELVGADSYCTNSPRYIDGPHGTATDGACRARCDSDTECGYYAWWNDEGCRTWDSCFVDTYVGATLWKRHIYEHVIA